MCILIPFVNVHSRCSHPQVHLQFNQIFTTLWGVLKVKAENFNICHKQRQQIFVNLESMKTILRIDFFIFYYHLAQRGPLSRQILVHWFVWPWVCIAGTPVHHTVSLFLEIHRKFHHSRWLDTMLCAQSESVPGCSFSTSQSMAIWVYIGQSPSEQATVHPPEYSLEKSQAGSLPQGNKFIQDFFIPSWCRSFSHQNPMSFLTC